MVKIANDFNKDLDKYIDSRQTSRPTDFLINLKKKSKNPEEEVPEMDDHEVIVEQRELNFFERLFKRKKRDEEDYEEVEEFMDETIAATNNMEELEQEYEDLDEAEAIIEEKKQNVFSKILSKIRNSMRRDPDDIPPEEVAETMGESIYEEGSFIVPQDIKEAMRIQNNWLKKLPNNLMMSFKNSEDYKHYQEILQKYGLIK